MTDAQLKLWADERALTVRLVDAMKRALDFVQDPEQCAGFLEDGLAYAEDRFYEQA